jgi:non-homologous end joining protein Ku
MEGFVVVRDALKSAKKVAIAIVVIASTLLLLRKERRS